MATPVLLTKLFRPAKQSNFVERPRLIDKLDAGLDRRLTLVSAPAGFGKTTLISDWIDNSNRAGVWLSLDKHDNDLSRFLTYLITCVQQIDESIGADILSALNASQAPDQDLLVGLVNDLAQVKDDFILVLDDYHLIEAEPIHEAVDFLLDHMPNNMHLAITGRSDPPLPLARLRVRRQMTEIRAADLKFTTNEAASFFNDFMDLELSTAEIATLESRTEGWIASLHLAALSLQGRENKHDFIAAFSGGHHHLIDYLVDEVLLRQPPQIQSFLLKTSILSRISASLCDHLLESSTSVENLEQLEKSNLFVIQLDDERQWYRYHHLFADFLQQRLQVKEPQELANLHRRAAQWLRENGFTHEAIGHAFAAGDVDMAADIIDSICMSMAMDSQLVTLSEWQSRLPEVVVAARPWLCISFAWSRLLTGEIAAVEPLLQKAETAIANRETAADDDAEVRGYITVMRAFIARGMGEFRRAIEISLEARKKLSEEDLAIWGILALNLGNSYLACGELVEADKTLTEAGTACRKARNYYAEIAAISNRSYLQMIQGHLQEAAKIAQKAIQLGTERGGGHPLPATGYGYVGLGQVFYEWNNLSEAESNLVRGLELGKKINEVSILMRGNLALARLRVTQGDSDAAMVALNHARELAPCCRLPEGPQIDGWEMDIKLALGNLEEPRRWADEYANQSREPLDYLNFRLDLTLARVRLEQGRPAETLGVLETLLPAAKAAGRHGDMVEILALTALAQASDGEKEEAMAALQKALELGEPEGYARTFIDNGQPMAALLKEAVARGICRDYAAKLLKIFGGESGRKTSRSAGHLTGNQPLVDPLSDRELEVVALVADGLKYQEIADKLVVSLNTIRTHSKNIYTKLGVDNRTKAIDKARELKLI